MTLLGKIRAGQTTWGRRVLSVFVVAWISAAMQPCLMAMEMAGPVEVTMAGDHSLSDHAEKHSCPHCPPSSPHSDQTRALMADCGELPDFKQGDRFSKLEVDDTWYQVVANAGFGLSPSAPKHVQSGRDCPNPKYAGDPPLNLKNCVFLK